MGESYDVIVAGGGPAGLMAARTASSQGANVLLLELQAQIGQNQTSAWVSDEFLRKEFSRSERSDVERIVIHSPNKELELEGDFGRIIDREIFDRILASKAVKAGVEVWVGSPVRGLLWENERVCGVRSEAGEWSEEIESEVVIDATGAKTEWSSIFLKEVLNSNWEGEKARTNEYLMANVLGERRVDIYFNSMLAPKGHAWIYPLDQEFATTGIRGVRIHPDIALDEFIGRETPERLKNSDPIGAYRGQSPVEGLLETMVGRGILAVGSSAGQIYPLSGHGLKYALESGRIAGRVVAEGIRKRDPAEERLSEYEQLWRNMFENEIRTGMLLRSYFEISPDRKMDTLLEVMEKNERLGRNFVNIFLGENLEKSIEEFFEEEKCAEIFGKERVEKILKLYRLS